jgi:SAM-dependent methyltransferase
MILREYKRLMAEYFDLVCSEVDGPELDFWLKMAAKADGPILELGSGTGRVLIPLLQRGYDITGIDTSPFMVERCHFKCREKSLTAIVHSQSMQELEIPNKYGLIILASCGLGLLLTDQEVYSALERVITHLRPGGLFVFEIEPIPILPRDNDKRWSGRWYRGPNDVIVASRRIINYDPDTHIWENLTIYEKFVSGRLIETEANDRTGRYYSVDEVIGFLRQAGFVEIRANHWLTEEPPREDSAVITFRCRRPE